MKEKTSAERYVLLAMKKEEILKTLSNYPPNSDEWHTANKQATSITQAIETGLELLGPERRASFFDYFNKTQLNSAQRYSKMIDPASPNESSKQKEELKLEQMKMLTGIINSTESLIYSLQLNYPSEFPNELVSEILKEQELQNFKSFDSNSLPQSNANQNLDHRCEDSIDIFTSNNQVQMHPCEQDKQ